ncbi:MAG: endolytic transglycosylase MltG, partial [Deltaproteobacteria bacterium]|nr:endolytic transglycosylase MltG [Deltaproteobacteria bacterium]
LVLASIIEKETGAGHERPLISAVFHNRLKIKMPLQSDPTIIYGVQNFDGNLTLVHKNTRTEYNTYQIGGLPPTPIANPGLESIKAALNPAKVDYLYFVSKGDGTHFFSKDYSTHRKAVKKYQVLPYRRKKS